MPRIAKREFSEDQLEAQKAGGERLRASAKRRSQLAQVRKMVETGEQTIGQDHPRELSATGPASVEDAIVQPVDKPVSKEKLKNLAFMEEYVTVMVHDSTDKLADPFPCVWNDGISQYFPRNEEIRVKRKYVEVLAHMKITTYSQQKIKDGQGNDTYRMIPHTALVYPFAMVEDSNPIGHAWLKATLAEA